MHIHMTNEAASRLQTIRDTSDAVYKLVYDAEGCGCAVSGVPALWLVDRSTKLDTDLTAAEGPTIIYEPRHEVFFEDRLALDYDDRSRSFKLKSSGQIYTNDLAVIDKRHI